MASNYIGQVLLVGFNYAPRGYALCNGAILPISQNAALFSLLGTTFGGNGTSTFGLPDLRGRVPIHQGQGPGLTNYVMGEMSGTENVTLVANQIPAHTHALNVSNAAATLGAPNGNFIAAKNRADPGFAAASDGSTLSSGSVAANAGGQPHSNLQPLLVMNYVIAITGVFPSRN